MAEKRKENSHFRRLLFKMRRVGKVLEAFDSIKHIPAIIGSFAALFGGAMEFFKYVKDVISSLLAKGPSNNEMDHPLQTWLDQSFTIDIVALGATILACILIFSYYGHHRHVFAHSLPTDDKRSLLWRLSYYWLVSFRISAVISAMMLCAITAITIACSVYVATYMGLVMALGSDSVNRMGPFSDTHLFPVYFRLLTLALFTLCFLAIFETMDAKQYRLKNLLAWFKTNLLGMAGVASLAVTTTYLTEDESGLQLLMIVCAAALLIGGLIFQWWVIQFVERTSTPLADVPLISLIDRATSRRRTSDAIVDDDDDVQPDDNSIAGKTSFDPAGTSLQNKGRVMNNDGSYAPIGLSLTEMTRPASARPATRTDPETGQ